MIEAPPLQHIPPRKHISGCRSNSGDTASRGQWSVRCHSSWSTDQLHRYLDHSQTRLSLPTNPRGSQPYLSSAGKDRVSWRCEPRPHRTCCAPSTSRGDVCPLVSTAKVMEDFDRC